jgi:Fic family protein
MKTPFTYNQLELQPLLDRIQENQVIIAAARPLPITALARIKHDIGLEWTYNSNSIEGNSLTLAETKIVLEEGMTIGGKSLREHFEAINHDKAIHYLEEIVSHEYELRSVDLLKLHELVMKNIDDEFGGRIRNGLVRIIGANFTPPAPPKVSDLLTELIEDINLNRPGLNIGVLATIFHHRFVWIHPFFDGNGRTGRLAMNLLLMKHGYPPAIILKNDRKKYYSALNLANKGDYTKLGLLVLQAIERSQNIYKNILPKSYAEFESIAKVVEDPEVPYGLEYVSLLARTGKINAHKEGRNWVTTKEAILDYIKSKNA